MEERMMAPTPEMAPMVQRDSANPGGTGLDDPKALQILATEHWSLLSARSLVYNEAFARAGMFLAFLSATLVALGLVTTATGFSDGFLTVAAFVLALDLYVGFATLGRINGASREDIHYLQGMNRIRHAYHEMVPGLEPYFSVSHYDDVASVLGVYGGETNGGPLADILHGLTTTPGMVSVLCSAIAGALGGVLLLLLTHDATIAGLGALGILVGMMVLMVTIGGMAVVRLWRSLEVRFPKDGAR